jgi:RND family efflux transporter MFP subunit
VKAPAKRSTALYLAGLVLLGSAIVGVWIIAKGKSAAAVEETAARTAAVAAGPRVRVAEARLSDKEKHVEFTGEARPYASVTLYGKVSGYLKKIAVDKGDHVVKDQLLAVIESPELDRQYDAAVADAKYKVANAKRLTALVPGGLVAQADAEQQESVARQAEATVAQLRTQKDYQELRAPFTGTVTARFADPGALVQSATSAQTGALPLVTVSETKRLRVWVYVEQRDATFVRAGQPAMVRVPERPEVELRGTITRVASELDPRTRTMLVEIDLPNKDEAVVPGSLVQVSLTIPTQQLVQIPVEALVVRDRRQYASVLEGDHIKLRPVEIADDDGALLRLRNGVKAGEKLALDLGSVAEDGMRVQPVIPVKKEK